MSEIVLNKPDKGCLPILYYYDKTCLKEDSSNIRYISKRIACCRIFISIEFSLVLVDLWNFGVELFKYKNMESKRFMALIIDVFIITSFCLFVRFILNIIGLGTMASFSIALSCVLLLCKDCYNGMSIGKRITNIQVFDSRTMKVASPIKCVLRNCFLIFNVVELFLVFYSSSSLRIGDYIACTKVLERNAILTKVSLYKVISTVGMVTIMFLILYIIAYNNAYRLGFFRLFFVP